VALVRSSLIRFVVVGLAAAAFVACASSPQYSTSSGNVDLADYPVPSLSATELNAIHGMADATILGNMITADSLEIVTADSLLRISKTDDVVNYAKMMIVDHRNGMKQTRELSKAIGLAPVTVNGGLRASHIAAALDSVRFASDATVDRRYITSQIMLHEHLLGELQALKSTAQNERIRDNIAMTIPMVREHLARAHAIAVTKGFEKKR
jgi:predicted outer membrane protein